MAEYLRYLKLERYVNGQPTGEYKKGDLIDIRDYESQEDCEHNAQYRWIDAGTTVCDGYSLYKEEKMQKSYDQGLTWTDVSPLQTRTGEMIEQWSTDCGWQILERWLSTGETMCDDSILMREFKKQVSYDMGSTWSDSIPLETRWEASGTSVQCLLQTEPLTYRYTSNRSSFPEMDLRPTISIGGIHPGCSLIAVDWGDGTDETIELVTPLNITNSGTVGTSTNVINLIQSGDFYDMVAVAEAQGKAVSSDIRDWAFGTETNNIVLFYHDQLNDLWYVGTQHTFTQYSNTYYYCTFDLKRPLTASTAFVENWSPQNLTHTYQQADGSYDIKVYGMVQKVGPLFTPTVKQSNNIYSDTYSITSWGSTESKISVDGNAYECTLRQFSGIPKIAPDDFGLNRCWYEKTQQKQLFTIRIAIINDKFPESVVGTNVSTYHTDYNKVVLNSITDTHSLALRSIYSFNLNGEYRTQGMLPTNLFRYATLLEEAYFDGGQGIIGIPSGFFDYTPNLVYSKFASSGVTSIPDRLYANTSQFRYDETFENCTSLTSIGTECLGTINTDLNPIAFTIRTEEIDYYGTGSSRTPRGFLVNYTLDGYPLSTLVGINLYENKHEGGLTPDFPYYKFGGIYLPYLKTIRTATGGELGTARHSPWNDSIVLYAEPYNTVWLAHTRAYGSVWPKKYSLFGGTDYIDNPTTYIKTAYITQDDKFLICVDTFKGCTALTTITNDIFLINVGITNGMFEGCTSLTSVPQSWVSKFGGYNTLDANITFLNNTYIVHRPNIVKAFSAISMFRGCSSLTTVLPLDNLSTSFKYVDLNSMYAGCHSITQVDWRNSTLGSKMYFMNFTFAWCSGLQSVNIAFTINNAQHSFALCNNLTSATIYANKASWTFYRCPSLTTIGGQINIVADHTYAFSGVTSCPDGLINDCIFTRCTFAYCDNLILVLAAKIGKYPFLTFMNCKNLDASNYLSMYLLYPYTSNTQVIEGGYRWTMAFAGCKNTSGLPAKWGGPCVYNGSTRTVQCRSGIKIDSTGEGEVFNRSELLELLGYVELYKINILEDYFNDLGFSGSSSVGYGTIYTEGVNNLYCIVSGLELQVNWSVYGSSQDFNLLSLHMLDLYDNPVLKMGTTESTSTRMEYNGYYSDRYNTGKPDDLTTSLSWNIEVNGYNRYARGPFAVYYWYTDTPTRMHAYDSFLGYFIYANSNIIYPYYYSGFSTNSKNRTGFHWNVTALQDKSNYVNFDIAMPRVDWVNLFTT